MATHERYKAALKALNDATREACIGRKLPDPMRMRLRDQTAGVVGNVLSGADLLLDVHATAVVVHGKHFALMQSMPKESGGAVPEPSQTLAMKSIETYFKHIGHLSACYQAVMFFVRSLQDTFYRWGVMRAGQQWGQPGMSKAIKCRPIAQDDPDLWGKKWEWIGAYNEENPVARILGAAVPNYPMWFAKWRDVRNRAKTGAPNTGYGQFYGSEGQLMICVQDDRPGGGIVTGDFRTAISLDTVAEGLEMSTRVAQVLFPQSRE